MEKRKNRVLFKGGKAFGESRGGDQKASLGTKRAHGRTNRDGVLFHWNSSPIGEKSLQK